MKQYNFNIKTDANNHKEAVIELKKLIKNMSPQDIIRYFGDEDIKKDYSKGSDSNDVLDLMKYSCKECRHFRESKKMFSKKNNLICGYHDVGIDYLNHVDINTYSCDNFCNKKQCSDCKIKYDCEGSTYYDDGLPFGAGF